MQLRLNSSFQTLVVCSWPNHAHMHTTKLLGIDMEVAKQLKTVFVFVPPLSAVSSDNLQDIHNVEKMMGTEFASDWDVDGKEVLQGRVFDFAELQHINASGKPQIT
ncbi:hypothetical protein BDR04DRAFT_1098596 [Suillus decipiens]|nr:hypothetical protein BDR04DRAFT_1098596 [Suillus decipiens]